jgi:hypothetical protein
VIGMTCKGTWLRSHLVGIGSEFGSRMRRRLRFVSGEVKSRKYWQFFTVVAAFVWKVKESR